MCLSRRRGRGMDGKGKSWPPYAPQTNSYFREQTQNLAGPAVYAAYPSRVAIYFSVSRYCILRLCCPEYETVLSIPVWYL